MSQTIRLARKIQSDSIVDGEGLRCVLWTQGCPHNCPGCHNPSTHSFTAGVITPVEEIIQELSQLLYHDGLTISGGEPMEQAEALIPILEYAQANNLNIWCYTGYTLEELKEKNNPSINRVLELIDILVDGKFILAEKTLSLPYRGSKNQRIIKLK